MTSWKKLLAGGAGMAVLAVWGVSLTDCTVCSGPQCFNDDGGGGTDTGTGSETSGGDSGGDSGMMGCSAVKPQGPLFWDNAQGTGTCDKCMASKCCTEAQACVGQMAADGSMDTCQDYLSCIEVCTDPDGGIDQNCVNACNQTDPMGKPVAETMIACLQSKCSTECM